MIDHNQAAYEQQARPFRGDAPAPWNGHLSGDVNLYNTVTLEKSLDGMDLEDVRRRLMFIKHKTMYKVWRRPP